MQLVTLFQFNKEIKIYLRESLAIFTLIKNQIGWTVLEKEKVLSISNYEISGKFRNSEKKFAKKCFFSRKNKCPQKGPKLG